MLNTLKQDTYLRVVAIEKMELAKAEISKMKLQIVSPVTIARLLLFVLFFIFSGQDGFGREWTKKN